MGNIMPKSTECNNKASIAIISNNEKDSSFLIDSLKFKHDVEYFYSEKDIFEFNNYDMFILSVDKLSPSVLSMISSIKSSTFEPPFVVVYVKGEITDNHKINAFKYGADDISSFDSPQREILIRVNRFFEYKSSSYEFKRQLDEKDRLIQTTIEQASQYGSILQLISSINKCDNYSALSDAVFNYLRQSNLEASMMISLDSEKDKFFDSETGMCTPIVSKVLVSSMGKRIHTFGARTIFTASNVSLLIKNMPLGQFNYDLYMDVLASMIESIEARINSIYQMENMKNSVEEISGIISIIDKDMLEVQHNKQKLMDDIILNIGQSFHVLDLNEEQENFLTDMIENILRKHADNTGKFNSIREMASHAVEKLMESMKNPEDNEPENNDVELF